MPILTECTNCDQPMFVGMGPGRFAPIECDECGFRSVIEMTRMPGGTTYPEGEFVKDVLPGLDGVERIDHPTEDVYIYGNPEQTTPR